MIVRVLIMTIILPTLLMAQSRKSQEQTDPYIWLEDIDSEQSLEWARKQNQKTLAVLKSHPAFQEIYEKNLEIFNSDERIAYPDIRGQFVYNFWQDATNERGVWRRALIKDYCKNQPAWETLIDIDALSKQEGEKWVFKGVSWLYPDYRRCMVQLSRGGGDAVVMREFDVFSKQFVEDGFYLPEAKGGLSWQDENTLIVSTDFGKGTTTESGYPRITKRWRRGTPLSEATTLFEGEKKDVSVWGYVIHTPERQYLAVHQGVSFFKSNKYVAENDELIKLDIPMDAELRGIFKNQILVELKSDWQIAGKTYKQGALISVDYNDFLSGNRNFKVIVEPSERSSVVSVDNTKNFVIVEMLTNVRSELYEYHLSNDRWQKEKVSAPDYGNIDIVSTDDASDQYFFTYNSFLTPTTLYFSPSGHKIEKVKSLPDFFDASKFRVTQHETQSKDGTVIPYFLVSGKDVKFDGRNPTLLYGYGGFEIAMQPAYSATIGTAWLERGGVYALANIRGGGEFGPKWHQAALKENRQRAFDDFIAVAEDLISRKITSPQHLGISGGSNGGLLVGVAFTQRPELFNAVVCRVPLLDMQRFNKLLAGASWMGEYGNPDKPEEWAYIKNYSPYQNVHPDRKYPKVFFNTSTRDDRVHPAHARKMVAKMLEMGHDVLYYENIEGGHAAATTNDQRAFSYALIYAYLLQQLK